MLRAQFIDFLSARGVISDDQRRLIRERTAQFREAVAAVALRQDLLSAHQLDDLMTSGSDINEAAVERGYLTRQQADSMMAVQDLKELMEVCEALIMEKIIEVDQLFAHLSSFLGALDTSP